ncbi:MAG: efflux RND transporter periplasmic adaptor subunit [Acidobacteriota bacterium]
MLESRRSAPRALVLSVPTLAAALLWGCGAPTPDGASTDASEVEAPPLVAVEEARVEPWRETVQLSVEMAPWAAVTVAAEVPGRVVDLRVDHGDRVGVGDVLARLDTATAEAELEQAVARHHAAVASLEQGRRDLERGRSLAGGNGILSKDELDRLRLAVATGEASAREAEAAVMVLEERLADMTVRAPFAGTVSERHAELGSWLGIGDPVLRLVDSRRLKARGAASQADRVRLDLDAAVEIRADALGDRAFSGRLRYLGAEADVSTGTYLVEAEVEAIQGAGQRLLPGMRGRMELEIESHSDLLLPRTALVDGDVFVVRDGVAVRRPVESEPIGPVRVRVLDGVAAGERIVVQGQHRLADGARVDIRDGGRP